MYTPCFYFFAGCNDFAHSSIVLTSSGVRIAPGFFFLNFFGGILFFHNSLYIAFALAACLSDVYVSHFDKFNFASANSFPGS